MGKTAASQAVERKNMDQGAGIRIRKDMPGIFDWGRESGKTHRPRE